MVCLAHALSSAPDWSQNASCPLPLVALGAQTISRRHATVDRSRECWAHHATMAIAIVSCGTRCTAAGGRFWGAPPRCKAAVVFPITTRANMRRRPHYNRLPSVRLLPVARRPDNEISSSVTIEVSTRQRRSKGVARLAAAKHKPVATIKHDILPAYSPPGGIAVDDKQLSTPRLLLKSPPSAMSAYDDVRQAISIDVCASHLPLVQTHYVLVSQPLTRA
mmetsp:Transcript_29300/g.70530  ORF Transcript_29300/g.70530 Transcript_29300/m.70530 type:complete len:220 (-) Transcript_29300:1403-2062(-)